MMTVSQTSGSSAAWMLQRLFQSSGDSDTTRTAESAGRQKLPGDNDPKSNAGGAAAPMMSGKTMGAMVSMQMEPPSASDVASDLVSSLDTNGDGEVSTEEITAAFSAADLDSNNVASALSAIDTDKNGALNTDELTTAIASDMQAQGHKRPNGPPPGGPPPGADDAASSILTAFDTDGDAGLSMDEILKAVNVDSDEDGNISSAFSSLDADGDGHINLAELTPAIQQDMDASYRAYAGAASLTG